MKCKFILAQGQGGKGGVLSIVLDRVGERRGGQKVSRGPTGRYARAESL